MNVSLERDKLHYQKEDIGKWLQYCIVETPQKSFTIEEVIKIVANKNGGRIITKKYLMMQYYYIQQQMKSIFLLLIK